MVQVEGDEGKEDCRKNESGQGSLVGIVDGRQARVYEGDGRNTEVEGQLGGEEAGKDDDALGLPEAIRETKKVKKVEDKLDENDPLSGSLGAVEEVGDHEDESY